MYKLIFFSLLIIVIMFLALNIYKFVIFILFRHYAIPYPHQNEYKYARKLRCSPLYSVLEKRGAVFGTRMGYERPLYFDTTYNGK